MRAQFVDTETAQDEEANFRAADMYRARNWNNTARTRQ